MPGTRQDYYAAWDFARLSLGTPSAGNRMEIAGNTVGATSGVYWHADAQTLASIGSIAKFQNYAWPSGTTVTFDPVTLRYTISRTATFTINFTGAQGSFFRRALGFRFSSYSGASSYTSDARPWYVIRALLPSGADDTGIYEADGRVWGGETESGGWYGIAPRRIARWREWTVRAESRVAPSDASWVANPGVAGAGVYADTTRIPWTWRHLFQHCRAHMPIGNANAGTTALSEVYVIRPEGAHFKPSRTFDAYDGAWDIPFRARVIFDEETDL